MAVYHRVVQVEYPSFQLIPWCLVPILDKGSNLEVWGLAKELNLTGLVLSFFLSFFRFFASRWGACETFLRSLVILSVNQSSWSWYRLLGFCPSFWRSLLLEYRNSLNGSSMNADIFLVTILQAGFFSYWQLCCRPDIGGVFKLIPHL